MVAHKTMWRIIRIDIELLGFFTNVFFGPVFWAFQYCICTHFYIIKT